MAGRLFFEGEDACHVAYYVDKFRAGWDHDFCVGAEGLFYGFEFSEELCVADEVFVCGVVDESDGFGLSFGGEYLCLPDAFGFFDLRSFEAVGFSFGGVGEIEGGDFFVFGFYDLVHGFLDVGGRVDFFQFGADDFHAPVSGFFGTRAGSRCAETGASEASSDGVEEAGEGWKEAEHDGEDEAISG